MTTTPHGYETVPSMVFLMDDKKVIAGHGATQEMLLRRWPMGTAGGCPGECWCMTLGGGTFDASLLQIEGDTMEVLAAEGDPFLGGTDFDDRVTGFLPTSLEDEHSSYLREDAVAVQRIRFAVFRRTCPVRRRVSRCSSLCGSTGRAS